MAGKHFASAVAAVEQALQRRGAILKAYDALRHQDVTCGANVTAVATPQQYAIWWKSASVTYATPRDAAYAFVNAVGSTRAREAAATVLKQSF